MLLILGYFVDFGWDILCAIVLNPENVNDNLICGPWLSLSSHLPGVHAGHCVINV